MAFNNKRTVDEKLTQSFREARQTKRDLAGLNAEQETVELLREILGQLQWIAQHLHARDQQ